MTTAPLALHKTGRYVCLWASGVQGPIAFLSARDWSPRLELPGFEPVLSNVVPWRRCSRSSANKNYWGSFEVCASLRARCSLILPLSPHTSPGGHCPHLAAFFFFFFNSSYSEKETLGTISNENPGIHEARGEACECSVVRKSSPRDTARNDFPGLSILEWRRGSLSADDITRQSWNAQMQKAEGPRGQEGVWP